MTRTLLERLAEDPERKRALLQESALLEVVCQVESLMKEQGITRAELARLLGKTKGWVTQLLDGEANKTIRTVADVFAVLNREFYPTHRPIRIGRQPAVLTAVPATAGAANTTVEERMILPFPPDDMTCAPQYTSQTQ